MPTEEQMTVNERRKYLKLMKVRYVAAKREERSRLLTEMHEQDLWQSTDAAQQERDEICCSRE
jgi:hypothetical protein